MFWNIYNKFLGGVEEGHNSEIKSSTDPSEPTTFFCYNYKGINNSTGAESFLKGWADQ